MAEAAGYSGTPLARKLSLKDGQHVWFAGMPESVRAQIDAGELDLIHLAAPEPGMDAAHIFVTDKAEMERQIALLRPLLQPTGFIWVSWPKKASMVPTDITEDAIRAVIRPDTDLVDVKVCAVDDVWSGLKLMIRKERR